MSATTTCPTWCTNHQYAAVAEDTFHRRDFVAPGEAIVAISLGITSQDLQPVLSWFSEEHVPGSEQARDMAAAPIAAADFMDSITDSGAA